MAERLKVAVNGARGRMGSMSSELVESAPDLELVARTDLGDDLISTVTRSGARVVLDFTTHAVALETFTAIVRAGARPVSGTSGFGPAQVEQARSLLEAEGTGGLIVPNFSVGAVLMMRFAREAATFFAHAEIVEMHHDRKADAPSGTAGLTARLIASARGDPPSAPVEQTETHAGARGALVSGVPVHSIRLPGALAHQEVLLSGPGEVLTVRHDSLSRESFHAGILLALRAAPHVRGLVHGLEELLIPS